jgi:hypothetical protein
MIFGALHTAKPGSMTLRPRSAKKPGSIPPSSGFEEDGGGVFRAEVGAPTLALADV